MYASPLTGSPDTTLLRTIETERLVRDWKEYFGIDIAGELREQEHVYLYRCNTTGLEFFTPPDLAGSATLYEKLQKLDWYYMADKWEFRVALRDLLDCHCRDVLEIGAAFGHFVKLGMEAGLNVRGFELNEEAVSCAREKSLPVERLDLEEASALYPNSLDALCGFQVLEHVTNPRDFLRWSIQMLRPGGKLIFCVPNSKSFLRYQYNLLDMPPHHMLHWSEESFRALEQLYPIKVERVVYEPLARYHISGYLAAYGDHFLPKHALGRLLLQGLVLPICRRGLALGLNRFLTGQSLYVRFRKV
jgi:SAM-dependent methyltransferase